VRDVSLKSDATSKDECGRIVYGTMKLSDPLLPVTSQKHGDFQRLFYMNEPVPEFADLDDAKLLYRINIQIHFDTTADA
jgi:hypothetical protein